MSEKKQTADFQVVRREARQELINARRAVMAGLTAVHAPCPTTESQQQCPICALLALIHSGLEEGEDDKGEASVT